MAVGALSVALGGAALAVGAGEGSLYPSDDVLYTQMARESLAAGRWLDPTWQGAVVFEKPPLAVWALMVSGGLLGWGEAAMRLPGILAGVVALAYGVRLAQLGAIELAGGAATERAGRAATWAGPLAALVCLGTVGFVATTRRPLTDPWLTAAVMGALVHGARAAQGGSRWHGVALGLWGGVGLMAKQVAIGPAALVVGLALLVTRRWVSLGLGAAVALAVAAPWHLAMGSAHPETFWPVYAGYHVAARASRSLVAEEDSAYYLETLLDQDPLLGPLLAMALLVAMGLVAMRRRTGAGPALAVAAGLGVVTVTVAQLAATRYYHYLMPVFPAAAAVAAAMLGAAAARSQASSFGRLGSAVAGVLSIAAFVMGPLIHLVAPDYAPASKALAETHVAPTPEGTRLIVWEAYDPALSWYGGRPGVIWTADERFHAIQISIDMMARADAVVRLGEDSVAAFLADPRPAVVVGPTSRAGSMAPFLARVRSERAVASRVDRDHVVVTIGPGSAAPREGGR